MTARVGAYVSPVDPARKAAALERNFRAGWEMQPGASSIEETFVLRAKDPTADLYVPTIYLPGPIGGQAKVRWVPMFVALGLAGFGGLVLAGAAAVAA